jgi:hypothetical protein
MALPKRIARKLGVPVNATATQVEEAMDRIDAAKKARAKAAKKARAKAAAEELRTGHRVLLSPAERRQAEGIERKPGALAS